MNSNFKETRRLINGDERKFLRYHAQNLRIGVSFKH